MRVAIHGAGELVDALGALARAAGSEVVAEPADLTIVSVPAGELRSYVRTLAPGPAARVVIATRGLEPETGKRLSELVTEESACLRVGAIAGPLLASEVRRKSPCALVAASPFREVAAAVGVALRSPLCRVYTAQDLAGVELAGALVEILAIALGTARGLGLGIGVEALLVARGIAEGGRLAERVGGDVRTFAGLAGVGDLVACAGAADHPGHRRGLALARGEKDADCVALCEALLARERNLPITVGVKMLAAGEVKAVDALTALMTRGHAGEWDP